MEPHINPRRGLLCHRCNRVTRRHRTPITQARAFSAQRSGTRILACADQRRRSAAVGVTATEEEYTECNESEANDTTGSAPCNGSNINFFRCWFGWREDRIRNARLICEKYLLAASRAAVTFQRSSDCGDSVERAATDGRKGRHTPRGR